MGLLSRVRDRVTGGRTGEAASRVVDTAASAGDAIVRAGQAGDRALDQISDDDTDPSDVDNGFSTSGGSEGLDAGFDTGGSPDNDPFSLDDTGGSENSSDDPFEL